MGVGLHPEVLNKHFEISRMLEEKAEKERELREIEEKLEQSYNEMERLVVA